LEREEALRLVREKVVEANLVKHMLAAEAVMRGLARRLEQDEVSWALAGLIHDLDYGCSQSGDRVYFSRSATSTVVGCAGKVPRCGRPGSS